MSEELKAFATDISQLLSSIDMKGAFNFYKKELDRLMWNNSTDINLIECNLDYMILYIHDEEEINYYMYVCEYLRRLNEDSYKFYTRELKRYINGEEEEF